MTQPTSDRPTWELSGFGDEIDADPVVQVAVLQALGAHAIEVRSAWGVNVVDLDDEQLAGLHRLFDERGQTVSAIASPIGKVPVDEPVEHELVRLRRAIAAAHALGTTNIRIFSFYFAGRTPESVRDDVLVRMRALADLAERGRTDALDDVEHPRGDVAVDVLLVLVQQGHALTLGEVGQRPHPDEDVVADVLGAAALEVEREDPDVRRAEGVRGTDRTGEP